MESSDDEEEYEESGGGTRLFGFMFGNVDNSGDLDADYLDEVLSFLAKTQFLYLFFASFIIKLCNCTV